MKNVYRILVEKLKGKNHLRNQGVDGRIILRWIFRKYVVEVWTGFIWLRIGASRGLF
jgi:hypothetical protein